MSTQGRSTYQATLDTASYFQDNTSELITEAKLRDSLTNLSDSTLFKKDDPFLRIVTATTGTEPAYVITLTNLYSGSYSQLMPILFNAHATNTGAATINVNSLGAKSLKRPDGTATQAGDIVSGQLYIINYDGTDFLIVPGFGGGTAFNLVTGSTDNAIIRADGTGGSTTQGSSATIDDSGNVAISGDITLQGILKEINPTGSMTLSGGTSSILGSNITLYAESNGAAANDFLFKAGSTTVLNYDHSATNWGFTGSLSVSSFTGTADALTGSTSGGVLTDVTIGSGLSLSSGTLSASGPVSSGSYTPTITNVANTDTRAVLGEMFYIEYDTFVIVNGGFTINASASGTETTIRFTLPISSSFTDDGEANGSGVVCDFKSGAPGGMVNVYADPVNEELELSFTSLSTGDDFIKFQCTYQKN